MTALAFMILALVLSTVSACHSLEMWALNALHIAILRIQNLPILLA